MPAFPMDRSDLDNPDDPTPPAASSSMQLDSTNDRPVPLPDHSAPLRGRYRVTRERILRERAMEERLVSDIAHLRLENAAHEAELEDASDASPITSTDRTPCPSSTFALSDRTANFLGANLICPKVALTLLELIAYRRNLMEDQHRRSYRRPVSLTVLRETVGEAARAFADEVDGDERERNMHVREHLRMLKELHERWAVLEMTGETGDSSDEADSDFIVVKRKKKRQTSKFSARKCARGKRRTHAGSFRGWTQGTPDASMDASLDERSGGDEQSAEGKEDDEWTAWAKGAGEGKGSEYVEERCGEMDADKEV